jgi:hypothetical protein
MSRVKQFSGESLPALRDPAGPGRVIGFWIVTALFCLQIGFTAYAQLRLPQVAEAFTHLGFPAYFRVELSWATSSGAACRPRRRAPSRAVSIAFPAGPGCRDELSLRRG